MNGGENKIVTHSATQLPNGGKQPVSNKLVIAVVSLAILTFLGILSETSLNIGVIGQNVCPFCLVFLCGSGRFSCSSCMGGELEVGQNVCPEWPVRPCGTTVE